MKLILLLTICVLAKVEWDYFLFVQVWPGSWLYGQKEYNFTNDYFTVHGLWPQYINNSWPQYCNAEKFNLSTLKPIVNNLTKYWTDFRNPTKFWAHEYYRHLSCIEEDMIFQNELVCFEMGLNFRQKYDYYHILENLGILPTNSKNYTVSSIITAIESYTNTSPILTCDYNGILNEIRICFDQNITIIECPDLAKEEGCKSKYIWYNLYK